MDTKGLQKEFIAWCKSNNHSPKSEDETKQLFHKFMLEKHPQEYKAAMEKQKQQAQKALHGAKLQYFKSLKNQCAEDEEIVYYKKGGSVTCGCKKKEQGGEIPVAKEGSAVEKFKARKMSNGGVPKDSTKVKYPDPTEGGKKVYDPNTKKYRPVTEEDKKKWKKNLEDARKGKGEGTPQRKKGGELEKGKICPKCSKVHAAHGGMCMAESPIYKFKIHRLGGKISFSL